MLWAVMTDTTLAGTFCSSSWCQFCRGGRDLPAPQQMMHCMFCLCICPYVQPTYPFGTRWWAVSSCSSLGLTRCRILIKHDFRQCGK